jgi:hypothetical protein
MTQPYVSGPVDIWCGVGPGYTPLLLGWCEKFPTIQIRPSYSPVFVDIGGQMVPLDWMYQGEEALVSGDIIKWNENTYANIAAKSNRATPVRGYNGPGEMGTLMVGEGVAYPLWLRFPYTGKAAFQQAVSGSMPAGYRFVASFLMNDDMPQLGTAARKIHLVWHCVRVFDPTVITSVGLGSLKLFDHDMSGLGLIN